MRSRVPKRPKQGDDWLFVGWAFVNWTDEALAQVEMATTRATKKVIIDLPGILAFESSIAALGPRYYIRGDLVDA